MNVEIALYKHQQEFCEDVTSRELALVGGYACGKTHSFCVKAVDLASKNIGHRGMLLSPTMGMVTTNLIPEFEELLGKIGVPFVKKMSPYPQFELFFEGGSTIILLGSAENHMRHRGLNLAFFGIDEMDTINSDLAEEIWFTFMGRIRKGPVQQGFTTSTPEGFKFLYKHFVETAEGTDRRIIKGKTRDNLGLDDDYIDNLMSLYPEELIAAYLEGEFVNLHSSPVYYAFNREENNTELTIEDFDKNATLYIGQDFNINHCASIVHCFKDNKVYAVDEIIDAFNTEAVVKIIQERYPGRHIVIYPDAAGTQRKTSASVSDIALLQQGTGFEVKYRSVNPFVHDRVMSMNGMFCNAKGERKYFINTSKCKRYTECLERQTYVNGSPDKSGNVDHPLDAAGYFIHYHYSIAPKRGTIKTN